MIRNRNGSKKYLARSARCEDVQRPPGSAQSNAGTKSSSGIVRKSGAPKYLREHHLRRLIPVAPEEIADVSPASRLHIVTLLKRALRAERTRGRAGHWAYDLNRHISLLEALKSEISALEADAGRTRLKATWDGAA